MSKREAIERLLGNRSVHKPVNTGIQEQKKKKATFDLDPDLHKALKTFAATRNRSMVDILESAIREYIERQ